MRLMQDIRGSMNRTESVKNHGRRILAQTIWRVLPSSLPRVFANSIPKAGTHLLLQCLDLMPAIHNSGYFISEIRRNQIQDLGDYKSALSRIGPGCYVAGHQPYSKKNRLCLEQLQYRQILIVRDPHDVVISHFFHILNRPTNRLHNYMTRLPNKDAQILALIEGIPPQPDGGFLGLIGIGHQYERYIEWANHGALLVRYEDLVGPQGGGAEEAQRNAVYNIGAHIGVSLSSQEQQRVIENAYNRRSKTFRQGKINNWEEHFSKANRDAIHTSIGHILDKLGYRNGLH